MSVQARLYPDTSQDWNTFPDPLPAQAYSGEIDLFLHLQKERLKEAVQQQKIQNLSSFLSALEAKAASAMRKTEYELSIAMAKNRELADCVRRAEMETEAWERAAKENESTISGLNEMLGRAQEMVYWAGAPQDEESGCGGGVEEGKMGCNCRVCGRETACVVVFPCRHLCGWCRECGGAMEMCPVCGCVNEGMVQVFF